MNVRLSATRILTKLLRREGSLSTLLPDALQQIPARDRGLLQELCYGTCRWQPKLDCYVQTLLQKPLRSKDLDVHALLLLGLYQLTNMRVPAHAAIGETVSVASALKKPWAKGLVNGVLRRFQREQSQLDHQLADRIAFKTAHPAWLVDALEKAWPQPLAAIIAANNAHPPMTLRVNQRRISRDKYLQKLQAQNIECRPTHHSGQGIQLQTARDVEQLPGFSVGECSVQDEAAQLAAGLLQLTPNQRVLDACCAPGGKTAHLLETEPAIRCVAIDISADRIQRTQLTLQRLQLEAELKVADAAQPSQWWDGQVFDRILLDAPCSATGVIRRHPDIKVLREADNIAKLVATQSHLLESLWPLLADGGILLYATCSVLPQENAELIKTFVQSHNDAQQQTIETSWGIAQEYGRQLLPEIDGSDGFYYCTLKKVGAKESTH